jgi:hypothetical protein
MKVTRVDEYEIEEDGVKLGRFRVTDTWRGISCLQCVSGDLEGEWMIVKLTSVDIGSPFVGVRNTTIVIETSERIQRALAPSPCG